MIKEMNAREKIIYFAKKEFLLYGFKDASLRHIASAADLTTGAIYTYFKNKDDLFEAIVNPVCEEVERMFSKISESYYNSEGIVSDIILEKSLEDFKYIYNYIYSNFDVFKILVSGCNGSSKSDFVHNIVDLEVKHTIAYLDKMGINIEENPKINSTIIHTISESYINAILEPIRHNLSYDKAIENLDFLVIFYTGGWKSIFCELLNQKKYV
jgi:AcrR family transcriptional regulator